MSRRELLSHAAMLPHLQLSIHATDDPDAGGVNHRYVISGYDCTTNPSGDPRVLHDTVVVFQNGVLKEAGANGVTELALLAIVEDRLSCFQAGPFACAENKDALAGIRHAINQLNKRTARRTEADIEGTHQEDPKPDSTGLGDRFVEGKNEVDETEPKEDDDGKSDTDVEPTEAELAALKEKAEKDARKPKTQSPRASKGPWA